MSRGRVDPGPGQESVWDYPRPPRVEDVPKPVRVVFGGETAAETTREKRVRERSQPPAWYIPPEGIRPGALRAAVGSSWCEWKGEAASHDAVAGGAAARRAARSCPEPTPGFGELAGYAAFYPSGMEACLVDGERVRTQEGDFYGGSITPQLVGLFKGGPGTWGW